MTQYTVRQFLDLNYLNADRAACRLISGRARSYHIRHKLQIGHINIGGRRYANAYDVEVLALICRNHVGLRRKV